MTASLGISAYYHDSAAALVVDGQLVAAAQEERFSRQKHDDRFPSRAIEYCLAEAGLTLADVDQIGFYERPLAKFDRLLETHLNYAPTRSRSFRLALGPWLNWKLRMAAQIRRELALPKRHPLHFCDHHLAHAVSAFACSPFSEAAVVTIDAVGEWATTTIGIGAQGRIKPLAKLDFPHSLGLLYSTFTAFSGFRVNDGEYKLMGLAPSGAPRFVDLICQELIDLREDGSFRLNLDYFDFTGNESMFTQRFERLFDNSPRSPDAPIREIDRDLAASIQQVTELVLGKIAAHAQRLSGMNRLCLAGGVALNCAATGRLLRDAEFDDIWVQPAAGDAGGAIGVALHLDQQLPPDRSSPRGRPAFDNRLGPEFDDDELARWLASIGLPFRTYAREDELCAEVAQLIGRGQVVGWFQERMEFGPRALGSRSILADPRDPTMQSKLNQKIKFRESFRPFAPIVLEKQAHEWFELGEHRQQPYMTFVFPVRADKRDRLPAITHLDGTARVQTVANTEGRRISRLLAAFAAQTGVPVLINTSFNVADEPIVCTPSDAVRCFLATDIDLLVLGNHVINKTDPVVNGEDYRGLNESAASLPVQLSIWQRFTQATEPMRQIIEAILITLFYFVVITPLGWLMRLGGFDPLRLRPLPADQSGWIVVTEPLQADEETGRAPASNTAKYGLLGEFLQFLREEKKWWLAPLLLMIAALSLLVAVTASPVAPFIYTLF